MCLGIELFVSHSGMEDRESTCKFPNERRAFRNLQVFRLWFMFHHSLFNIRIMNNEQFIIHYSNIE